MTTANRAAAVEVKAPGDGAAKKRAAQIADILCDEYLAFRRSLKTTAKAQAVAPPDIDTELREKRLCLRGRARSNPPDHGPMMEDDASDCARPRSSRSECVQRRAPNCRCQRNEGERR